MLFIRLYRWALFVMSPGAGLFLFSVAMAKTVPDTLILEKTCLLGLFFAGSVVLTCLLRPLGRHFLWLWAWVGLIFAVWAAACFEPGYLGWFLRLSNKARLGCFYAVVVLQFLAVVESFLRRRRLRAETQLAYCAFIYLPFIAINSLMVWLTLVGLGWLSKTWPESYRVWENDLLSKAKHFDLARIEYATTAFFLALGLVALALPVLGYWLKIGSKGGDFPAGVNRRGRGAQNGAAILLAITPAVLLALVVYLSKIYMQTGNAAPNESILAIYRTSALRTLPLLAWLVGPFAVVLEVIGGVLFYLQPNPYHPAAIKQRCEKRLKLALRYAGKAPGRQVIVLAHSQGSVIASDLKLTGDWDGPLITIGSPVQSLYQRFLGIDKLHDGQSPPADWLNAYRDGDVIAGPITGLTNCNMGKGGHTGYWFDPELGKIFKMAWSMITQPKLQTPDLGAAPAAREVNRRG
jgi:hypothetical protein